MTLAIRYAAGDVATMIGRSVRHVFRNVDTLLVSLVLPVMLMLVFVYVFGGAIRTGGVRYVDYVAPGIMLLCAGYGAAGTSLVVAQDMSRGVIDRFRSMPMSRVAVLTGHVCGSLVRNALTATLVVAVALLIGWRPTASPGEWLAVIGLLALYVMAIAWIATVVGLLVRAPEAAEGFAFVILFLPYIGSGFIPTDTMPSWLRAFADHQPTTPVTETLRGLLMGTPIGSSGPVALAWCAGLAVAGCAGAAVLYGRRTAR